MLETANDGQGRPQVFDLVFNWVAHCHYTVDCFSLIRKRLTLRNENIFIASSPIAPIGRYCIKFRTTFCEMHNNLTAKQAAFLKNLSITELNEMQKTVIEDCFFC